MGSYQHGDEHDMAMLLDLMVGCSGCRMHHLLLLLTLTGEGAGATCGRVGEARLVAAITDCNNQSTQQTGRRGTQPT